MSYLKVKQALGRLLKHKPRSTTMKSHTKEGTIPFVVDGQTCQTWYKVVGDLANRTATPLVVLHGGPGMAHDYLVPIADLSPSRAVIFYDQIGNARSTHLPDKPQTFWTIDLFIDELVNLLQHFGIQEDFALLGHSWGGILAAEFEVRRHPPGLKRMVLSDSLAAMSLWNQSMMQLMAAFPEDVQKDLIAGPADMKKYRAALEKFYVVHGCRLKPQPKEIAAGALDPIFGNKKTGEGGDPTVSFAMNGGVLKDWTIVDRLREVRVPTYIINGREDIAQDFVVQPFFDNIREAKWSTFEHSSHTPMWEERDRYMKVVEKFLSL